MAAGKQQIVVLWMSSVLCQREKHQIHSALDQTEQFKECYKGGNTMNLLKCESQCSMFK